MVVQLYSLMVFALLQFAGVQPSVTLQPSDSLISSNWTIENGLPVNSTNSILQDKNGYIWFTTYDGIVRFDGIGFVTYSSANTPEMPQNRATHIYEQKNSTIWVSLENGGILKFTESEVSHYNSSNDFTNADVKHIVEDETGRIWFSTARGLYRYDGESFKRFINRDSSAGNLVERIFIDKDNIIYASTGNGIVVIENDEESYLYASNSEDEIPVFHVRRIGDNLYAGTMKGLYLIEGASLTIPEYFQDLQGVHIVNFILLNDELIINTYDGFYRHINGELQKLHSYRDNRDAYFRYYTDSRGVIWLINLRGHLSIYDGDQITRMNGIQNIPDYHYNNILEDREGNIWLTTARSGVVRIKRSKVRMIGSPEGLTAGNILGLFEDSRQRYWVATRDYGLNMIDGEQITHFREADGFSTDIPQTITEGPNGNIWVGHYEGGVDILSDSGHRNIRFGNNLSLNDIRAFQPGSDGVMWIGTYAGIIRYNTADDTYQVYNRLNGLGGQLVRYLDMDMEGNLWIATQDGGLSVFDGNEFINFSTDDGLSSNNIRSVFADEDDPGTIWVGTETNGLNRIRDGEIKHTGVQDGLPDHIVHFISQDERGWLWVSSNRGIIKINKEELNLFLDGEKDTYGIIHYGTEEGMRNPEANGSFKQGGLRTSSGEFWFSTQEGVAIFEINPEITNNVPPGIMLKGVSAANRNFSGESVSLPSGERNPGIHYHALTFSSPEKTRFRYKLEGYDESWQEVINIRTAEYAGLPNGEYIFRVMAANDDGIWSEEAELVLIINPVFYQQIWFYLLMLIVIAAGSWGISKIRYRYLMNRQQELESTIHEQTSKLRAEKLEIERKNEIIRNQAKSLEESNKTKDKFFSIIAHDLRNPFQGLLGLSEVMLNSFEDFSREEQYEMLREIRNASQSLHSLSENLLHWATIQTGKLEPYFEKVSVTALARKNVELNESIAEQKEVTINTDFDEEIYVKADRNMIDLVIRNLVSNAMKFTPKGGAVTVSVKVEDDQCKFSVTDTGVGISEKEISSILDPDTTITTPGTNNEKGTGLGLVICTEMVAMHNGNMDIESELKKGSRFTFTIPGVLNS